MWPFIKKEKLISNKAPYHYFAVYNTIMDIAKKQGKIYDHLSLERLVFLTYCIYYAGRKKPLIFESFFLFTPGIIITDSIWDYEVLHRLNNEQPMTRYIGDDYDMLIDENCEDYKDISTIYDGYSTLSDIELYVRVKDCDIKLDDGTVLPCPSKKIMIDNGFEKYYNGGEREYSYREEVLNKVYNKKLFMDVDYICKYYSHFFDGQLPQAKA